MKGLKKWKIDSSYMNSDIFLLFLHVFMAKLYKKDTKWAQIGSYQATVLCEGQKPCIVSNSAERSSLQLMNGQH